VSDMQGPDRRAGEDETMAQAVCAGEVAGLLAAYRRAVALAATLRAMLSAAGMGCVAVTASVDECGQPMVRPVLTAEGGQLLADMLSRWRHKRGDPAEGECSGEVVPEHPPRTGGQSHAA
jgi:hypothetical protein